ncbi:LPS export ABC transporter permease LptF [Phyllobacterium leguminum]|uniref:Lipopolysaccharide export system permease protein n=1 Tax=Phyllobacterium leguminum TaxID=314237 RepID=A0A318T1Y2_9HYPH|nr:LPS export ABC transporter permease LptF [Phyllobacterium leguminum]PYE88541.1 lipopolysaccharide export system permease protein [Phyllobacterium leguminum]
MRLIEFYILRRVALMFFAVLGAAVGITWTVQVLQRVDFLTTSGQTFQTILTFSSLLLPSAIPLVMPFALVIAITQTLSTMNQDSELVVINAAGSPRSAVFRPILLFAVAISIASFTIANFVDPYARMNMREMIASAGADLINVVLQDGTFRQIGDNLYVQIAERKENGEIGGLFIADSRDPNVDLIYYAADGRVARSGNDDVLLMENGEVQRRDVKTGNVSIIKFNSYAFDLSQFASTADEKTIFAKDRPLSYLLNPDPNDPQFQQKPMRFTAELNKRLTNWLYPIVFALIALAVAGDSRSYREARISASFTAITGSLIVYWAGYFASERADKSFDYVYLMYTIPIWVSAVAIYLLATGRRFGLPAWLSDRINDRFDALRTSITALSRRTAKRTGGGQ